MSVLTEGGGASISCIGRFTHRRCPPQRRCLELMGSKFQAGLRASRWSWCSGAITFPCQRHSGALDCLSPDYRCGGSAGLSPASRFTHCIRRTIASPVGTLRAP